MSYTLYYFAAMGVALLFACALGRAAKRADVVDERIHDVLRNR